MTSARDFARAVNPQGWHPDAKPEPRNYAHPDDYLRACTAWRMSKTVHELSLVHAATLECLAEGRPVHWLVDVYEIYQLTAADNDGMYDRRAHE